ncbi:MAG TPA: hypothetical protein VMG99_06295 [Thermoplasmata archaeon]|jgi:hypothetical protein|nr:hypothetical protein [Thermoplasmata archaeon]
MATRHPTPMEDDRGAYVGWLVGGLVILAVVVVMAGLWFHYHGL